MTPNTHLTEDQLDDLLIEGMDSFAASTPAAAAHFRACDPCQIRFAEAEAPVASFRHMSLAWAERRSATLPLRPVAQPSSNTPLAWASLATACTAILALAVARPSTHLLHRSAPITEQANLAVIGHTGVKSITPIAATPDQIARDNRMLNEIDQALGAPSESAETYGLEPAASHTRAHVRLASVRD
jgi:hypothetical protein